MMGQFWKLATLTTLTIGSFSSATFAAQPLEPITVITDLDAALNRKDVTAVTNLLSLNFTHGDGYTRQSLTQSLQALWQQYPNLTYRTEIIKTEARENAKEVETLTTIDGKRNIKGQIWKIQGTVRALQVIASGEVRSQTILAEQTQVRIGEKPPTVTVSLPTTVTVGKDYSYDVIVQEPVNDDLFMGTILDEPVSAALMANPTRLQLEFPSLAELLTGRPTRRRSVSSSSAAETSMLKSVKLSRMKSGGFFKIGRASNVPETLWISAILARHDGGITIATTRLRTIK